jgi:hypothetical protein
MSDNIKVGDTVWLDEGCFNKSHVEVVWLGNYIASVKADDAQWDVMRNRLSPIIN